MLSQTCSHRWQIVTRAPSEKSKVADKGRWLGPGQTQQEAQAGQIEDLITRAGPSLAAPEPATAAVTAAGPRQVSIQGPSEAEQEQRRQGQLTLCHEPDSHRHDRRSTVASADLEGHWRIGQRAQL